MTALLLMGPQTPLLFQGQEFCASSHFCYFADVGEEIGEIVRKGRVDFLSQFRSIKDPDIQNQIPHHGDVGTFERCKLDQSERTRNAQALALHRDLLKLRRVDNVFNAQLSEWIQGAVLGPEAFALRFFGKDLGDRLLVVNFGRDLTLTQIPEPLLSPPADSLWEVLWSSESPRYGGGGTPELETNEGWLIPGRAAVVLAPKRIVSMFRDEKLLE